MQPTAQHWSKSASREGLIEEEERRREVLGMSALGKCRALVDIATALETEGRQHDAKALQGLFKGQNMSDWNTETMTRYLSVGRKLLAMPDVLRLLERWEFYLGRAALFDQITALRAFASLNISDEDYMYVARALDATQGAGIIPSYAVSAQCAPAPVAERKSGQDPLP
jgi:hypothetical protein